MLFDKLLLAVRPPSKARDNGSTVHAQPPTIVVEPARPIIQIPKPAWWERILPIVTSLASVVVAIVALTVAGRSYQDQRDAHIQSVSATISQYADRVSSWIMPPSAGRPAQLIVQNLSSTPIYGASAVLIGKYTQSEISYGRGSANETLGNIPPCSRATLALSNDTVQMLDMPLQFVHVDPLDFFDVNGVQWDRRANGILESSQTGAAPPNPRVSPGVKISQAPAGCS